MEGESGSQRERERKKGQRRMSETEAEAYSNQKIVAIAQNSFNVSRERTHQFFRTSKQLFKQNIVVPATTTTVPIASLAKVLYVSKANKDKRKTRSDN